MGHNVGVYSHIWCVREKVIMKYVMGYDLQFYQTFKGHNYTFGVNYGDVLY